MDFFDGSSDVREGEAAAILADPGQRIAAGLQAFGSGSYARAWLNLRGAAPELQRIGGSHAQRDVFTRLTIESALLGGYTDAAEQMLHERRRLRGGFEDGYTRRRLDLLNAARERAV